MATKLSCGDQVLCNTDHHELAIPRGAAGIVRGVGEDFGESVMIQWLPLESRLYTVEPASSLIFVFADVEQQVAMDLGLSTSPWSEPC